MDSLSNRTDLFRQVFRYPEAKCPAGLDLLQIPLFRKREEICASCLINDPVRVLMRFNRINKIRVLQGMLDERLLTMIHPGCFPQEAQRFPILLLFPFEIILQLPYSQSYHPEVVNHKVGEIVVILFRVQKGLLILLFRFQKDS